MSVGQQRKEAMQKLRVAEFGRDQALAENARLRQRVEELEREKAGARVTAIEALSLLAGDGKDSGALCNLRAEAAEAGMMKWIKKCEAAEAEVAEYRAQGMVPAGAWAHDLERLKAAEAALREWREAESAPDCVACCTLDAALAPEVK